MSMTLIHTTSLPEAQALINFLKLTQKTDVSNLPNANKLFIDKDEKFLLIVSGIGKENTKKSLDFIFSNFEISKAINIGIAGCSDSSVKVGTLFCTNRLLPNINFAAITTVDTPLESDENLETLLVDMEAKYFLEISKANCKEIFIFKIVADYLDVETPKNSFVVDIIQKTLPLWKKYI